MEEAYRAARGLALSLRGDLDQLDKAGSGGTGAPSASSLQRKAADLGRLNQRVQAAQRVRELQQGPREGAWQRKADQLQEDTAALQRAVDLGVSRQAQHAKERQQLFEGRAAAAAAPAGAWQAEGVARSAVESSKRMLEDTLQAGAAALLELGSQRDTLKAAQRKALDALHSLGLSESILRLIERRHNMDKILIFGGMGCVSLALLLLLYYLKG